MILRGVWLRREWPIFRGRIILPDKTSKLCFFLCDTGASKTVVAEYEFPKGKIESLSIKTIPFVTMSGNVSGRVVTHCTLVLQDWNRQCEKRFRLPLYFVSERVLKPEQHETFRKVLGKDSPRGMALPRNLLGRDVLNRFSLVARKPNQLILTDISVDWERIIEKSSKK